MRLTVFQGPNGMSLRPGGFNMGEIIANYKGAHRIIVIPKGKPSYVSSQVPDRLCLL